MSMDYTVEEFKVYRKVLACDVRRDMIDYFDRLRGSKSDEYVDSKIEWVKSLDMEDVLDYYDEFLRNAYWDGEQFDVNMDYMMEEIE